MCIILDVNSFSNFRNADNEDLDPVRNWLESASGKIVYSSTEKFRCEWEAGGGYEMMIKLLYPGSSPSSSIRMGWEQTMMELQRMGKFKLVPPDDVQAKADALEQSGELRSDDPHIIALAIIARVKVLVVQPLPTTPRLRGRRRARGADTALQADFKNRKFVGGKVYTTKSHSHLLRRDTCP